MSKMMTATLIYIQRMFTLVAMALWFGGFTIYTGVVVRIAGPMVGHLQQGYVTQRVMLKLHLFAEIMLGLILIDIIVGWMAAGKWFRILQCLTFLVMLISLLTVVITYQQLSLQLDATELLQPVYREFKPLHQRYQLFSTFLWVATIVYFGLVTKRNMPLTIKAST